VLKRYLTTHKSDGSFDFISNIIEIKKYDSKHKKYLEELLINGSGNIVDLHGMDSSALALMSHEATHFLDLTATTWGLEYTYRKYLLADKLKNNLPYDEQLKVFMINTSEIQIHSELVIVFDESSLSNCILNHEVIYNKKFGSLIMVNFEHNGKVVRSVPLSMLSVMEANAYASEILLKIKIIESNEDEFTTIVSLKILESEFQKFINEPDLSEYNLLLNLCEIHLNFISLKHRLIFLQAVIRFVLNLGVMNLSGISSLIRRTFINKEIGNSICMDLQRGSSRHVVVFKLLLLTYQFINESDEKEKLQRNIESNPYQLIQKMLDNYNIKVDDSFDYGEISEFNMILNSVDSLQSMFDKGILLNSSEYNRELLKNKTFFDFELNEFKLLDYVFLDESIISVPNRIPIDVISHFNDNSDIYGKLDGVFKKIKPSKFHIHPNDVAVYNL